MPDSLGQLDGLLLTVPKNRVVQRDGLLLTVPKNRVVQRDGIHFQGQRYLSPTLAPFVGLSVTIRYDPRDVSEIRVYDHDTYICTAITKPTPPSGSACATSRPPGAPAAASCAKRSTIASNVRPPAKSREPTTPRPGE